MDLLKLFSEKQPCGTELGFITVIQHGDTASVNVKSVSMLKNEIPVSGHREDMIAALCAIMVVHSTSLLACGAIRKRAGC